MFLSFGLLQKHEALTPPVNRWLLETYALMGEKTIIDNPRLIACE